MLVRDFQQGTVSCGGDRVVELEAGVHTWQGLGRVDGNRSRKLRKACSGEH